MNKEQESTDEMLWHDEEYQRWLEQKDEDELSPHVPISQEI